MYLRGRDLGPSDAGLPWLMLGTPRTAPEESPC